MDYRRQHALNTKLVRIFNTYGPRMNVNDGRVVSNFIVQALKGEDITIYGDGRSEEHTSELQSLMRISYAVFCLKKKKKDAVPIQNSYSPHIVSHTYDKAIYSTNIYTHISH